MASSRRTQGQKAPKDPLAQLAQQARKELQAQLDLLVQQVLVETLVHLVRTEPQVQQALQEQPGLLVLRATRVLPVPRVPQDPPDQRVRKDPRVSKASKVPPVRTGRQAPLVLQVPE